MYLKNESKNKCVPVRGCRCEHCLMAYFKTGSQQDHDKNCIGSSAISFMYPLQVSDEESEKWFISFFF